MKYKTLLLSLTICLQTSIYSQTNVFGYYERSEGPARILDIHSDSTFTYFFHPKCGVSPSYEASGEWSYKNDTTLLFIYNTGDSLELFIAKNGCLVDYYNTGTLIAYAKKEPMIISNYFINPFEKTKSYYSTGAIEWEIQDIDTINERCIYYYPNGAVKGEGILKNKKRKGTWRYYKENGEPDKKEFYREGKLKRTKTIS